MFLAFAATESGAPAPWVPPGARPSGGTVTAPAFTDKDLEDETISLADYRGRVVILNFWGTWCPPCKAEVPALERLKAEYRGELEIIGAAVFSSEDKVRQFYSDFQMNYPVIMGSYELMDEYGQVSAIPTTFIIDREGRIADTAVGFRNQAQDEDMVKPLLAN
jgi:thiol-disulfide isomerase/thioredoxin